MKTYRTHGNEPIQIVTVHGGPGDFGGMVQLAQALSDRYGVLEPFQTADTIAGQVRELHETVTQLASRPLVLIGHSWGAWLAAVFVATYPSAVRKLILVGSGPFESHYYSLLQQQRSARLTDDDVRQIEHLTASLSEPGETATGDVWRQLGAVFKRVDNVDLIDEAVEDVDAIDPAILDIPPASFHALLQEAMEMRKSGELLDYVKRITCPVVAIHGACDPHPYEGVQRPLQAHLPRVTCYLIQQCGHNPWLERHGRREFFRILEQELAACEVSSS